MTLSGNVVILHLGFKRKLNSRASNASKPLDK